MSRRNGEPRPEYPRAYLYRQVVRAKLYIDVNYAERLDLAHIAAEAYYSRHHFLRLFREIYGMTPQQYLRRVRMERAKRLLAEGRSVTEACVEVGFESLSTFSASFKSDTGFAPSEYARVCADRQESMRERPLSHVPGCFGARLSTGQNRNLE